MSLVLNPLSSKEIEHISKNPPQALLLTGQRGVGLFTIANHISKTILAIVQPLNAKGEIDSSGLISVEIVRHLYEQTRSKQSSNVTVIIDNADRMSNGAQSAFLKLLEEPGTHIHFILTSHHPQALLPTIHSRVTHAVIHPISKEQTKQFINKLEITDTKKKAQLQFIGEGLPAEITRLTNDEAYFDEKAAYMSDARDFLQKSPYEKMVLIQKYKSDRNAGIALIDSALTILQRTVIIRPQHTIIHQLDLLLDIRESLLKNLNVSLQLSRFVL